MVNYAYDEDLSDRYYCVFVLLVWASGANFALIIGYDSCNVGKIVIIIYLAAQAW
jgi:hypothetical protein